MWIDHVTEDQARGLVAVERLRDAGFGDRAILEINQIAGFFAWCNRTVSGLGVELEEFWEKGLSNL